MEGGDAPPDAVQAELDRAAIRDVMLRYAAGLDRRDFAMVRACFTMDACAEYSGKELDPGVDAIIAYVRGVSTFRATMHFVGNVLVELHGTTATSEMYTIAYLVEARDGDEVVHVRGLRYRDELVRNEYGWLIRQRVHVPEWMFDAQGLPPVMRRER